MSPSDEIGQLATGFAALDPDDPERVAAYARAANDQELERVLGEGERLMELLAFAREEPPSVAALDQASAALLAEIDRSDRRLRLGRRLVPLAMPLAAALVPVVLLLKHGVRVGDPRFLAGAGLFVLALAAGSLLLRFGTLVMAAAVAAAGVFALAVHQGGFGELHGAGCLSMTLMSAGAPLVAGGLFARMRFIEAGPMFFAGAASLGALAGMAALHMECPGYSLGHLLFFHAGGVLVAGLVGLAAGGLHRLRPVAAF